MGSYDPHKYIGLPPERSEEGVYEVTIQVRGSARVNRLLSRIVRSKTYDDVVSIAVALQADAEAPTERSAIERPGATAEADHGRTEPDGSELA